MLPGGATLLSGNDFTRVQSVVVKHEGTEFWGLQYHPEYDLHAGLRNWCGWGSSRMTPLA